MPTPREIQRQRLCLRRASNPIAGLRRMSVGGHQMKFSRRLFVHIAAATTALPALPRLAWAEAYPSRPVHLIVGFPPGGAADLISRLIGQWLSERLGQQIVVENRAGASSNIATDLVIHATPDGYTLLDLTSVNAWNVALYDNLKFDILHDVVPIASIYRGVNVVV